MDRSWMRNTAAGCAIACGAMVAGPGMLGTAVASADLFGIDIDVLHIFDHKQKKKSDHSAKVGNQRNAGPRKSNGSLGGSNASNGPKVSTGPKVKVGVSDSSAPSAARSASTAEAPQSTGVGVTGQVPSATVGGGAAQAPSAAVTIGTAQAPSAVVSGGGSGGGMPATGNIGRAPNLAPVPTAPSSRQIVIRSAPPKAPAAPAPAVPAAPVVPVAPAPVVVPPVPVIPAPVPSAPPAGVPPAAPSAPSSPAPRSEPPSAQPLSVPSVPESFRLGYADYLRTASTSDLLLAVLPGLGGMVLMTAAGGVVGFRQARAAQTLPSPQIARFLP
ncbi:hypothetical protein [Mycobacterium sp. DL99]|uniref:hypothetical protein n=1 Tax=Mycobacterium sp. DL99 TaxID=2528957 RepID=UPI00107FFDFC|nr:hypothetical protein [Mycobacterium sp. DL99]